MTVAAGTARANSTLLPADLLRVGSLGLRTRRLRAGLSALGIAIGIAAMVAVLGISQSSKADLIAQLDRLGTNLLRVAPGSTLFGETAKLPAEAPGMIGRIGPVLHVTPTGTVTGTVRRTDRIAAVEPAASASPRCAPISWQRSTGPWPRAASSTRPPPGIRPSSSARPPPNAWASAPPPARPGSFSPITGSPSSGSSTRCRWHPLSQQDGDFGANLRRF